MMMDEDYYIFCFFFFLVDLFLKSALDMFWGKLLDHIPLELQEGIV